MFYDGLWVTVFPQKVVAPPALTTVGCSNADKAISNG